MSYERPVIIVSDGYFEGVYAASGAVPGGGQDDAEDGRLVCQSRYMKGVYHESKATVFGNEYRRIDRGCEGCPAAQGGRCRLDLGPFGDPLMPFWERQHMNPNDTFIYDGSM